MSLFELYFSVPKAFLEVVYIFERPVKVMIVIAIVSDYLMSMVGRARGVVRSLTLYLCMGSASKWFYRH